MGTDQWLCICTGPHSLWVVCYPMRWCAGRTWGCLWKSNLCACGVSAQHLQWIFMCAARSKIKVYGIWKQKKFDERRVTGTFDRKNMLEGATLQEKLAHVFYDECLHKKNLKLRTNLIQFYQFLNCYVDQSSCVNFVTSSWMTMYTPSFPFIKIRRNVMIKNSMKTIMDDYMALSSWFFI
jgi:hypothetical protein